MPEDLRGWQKVLDLSSWVNSKRWDTWRFGVIDRARASWDAAGQEDFADDPVMLVKSTWEYFTKDQELADYVYNERDQDLLNPGDWEAVVKTYTWVVLQRYNREIEVGGDDDG